MADQPGRLSDEDVERILRDAMRYKAHRITKDTLRYPEMPAPAPPHDPGPWSIDRMQTRGERQPGERQPGEKRSGKKHSREKHSPPRKKRQSRRKHRISAPLVTGLMVCCMLGSLLLGVVIGRGNTAPAASAPSADPGLHVVTGAASVSGILVPLPDDWSAAEVSHEAGIWTVCLGPEPLFLPSGADCAAVVLQVSDLDADGRPVAFKPVQFPETCPGGTQRVLTQENGQFGGNVAVRYLYQCVESGRGAENESVAWQLPDGSVKIQSPLNKWVTETDNIARDIDFSGRHR